jgi:cell division protein FtsB
MVGIGLQELVVLLVVLGLFVATPIVIVLIIIGFSRRQDRGVTGELMRLQQENARLKEEVESLKRGQEA